MLRRNKMNKIKQFLVANHANQTQAMNALKHFLTRQPITKEEASAFWLRLKIVLALSILFGGLTQIGYTKYQYEFAEWACENKLLKQDVCDFTRIMKQNPGMPIYRVSVPCMENQTPPCYGLIIGQQKQRGGINVWTVNNST